MSATPPLPQWAEVFILPLINLFAAFVACGLVIFFLGENPFTVLKVMVTGLYSFPGNLGYWFYYSTNFIFTGLAVAVAFHAKLFNIGGEGQAMLGGLGVALVAITFGSSLPWYVMIFIIGLASMVFGALWGIIPGYLQAYRGSHIVITTIMFNLISAGVMVWLLSGALKEPGQQAPRSMPFEDSATLLRTEEIWAWFGFDVAGSPMNISFFIALLACFKVWYLIWHTRFGYEIRAIGHNPHAAHYAGISVPMVTVMAMAISGGLAGMMALNEVAGFSRVLNLNFTNGYGFTGIAVALIGRNHPVGIILASLLFGALIQGATEVDFEFSTITREITLLIQGMIILFAGALYYMFDPWLARLLGWILPSKKAVEHG